MPVKINTRVPALLYLLLASCSSGENIENEQPNIVFIFADDQCYDAINALGYNREVKTPNLDRLAKNGTAFTHAFNMGAWQPAVCMASRAMLNTGRYLWDAEKLDNSKAQDSLAGQEQFWPQLMKKAGYETYMTGKWHLRIKAKALFDHVIHERPGMPKDAFIANYNPIFTEMKKSYRQSGDVSALMPNGYNRPHSDKDTSWLPWDKSRGGYWEGGEHWSEVLGDDALGFLEKARESEKPFFMYLAFNAPHDPRQSPKEYVDMYPLEDISLPKSFQAEYPYKDEIGCPPYLRDEGLAPFPRTEYSVKVNRREYYAIITHMDHEIGRILDAIEASGKAGNTYVFFTADHGLAVGKHGFMGKQNLYDHSIRPPLLVSGPGIPKAKRIDDCVYLQDIMPTCLELAGVQKPEFVRFNSLMPLINGDRENSFYTTIYGCYMMEQRMIRNDNYKLIIYPGINVLRLYDLKNDPQERVDLMAQQGHDKIVSKLLEEFIKLQSEYNDPLDLSTILKKYKIL